MISTLVIQNFQSHKLSKLKFSNGINIIHGQSDSGKTAIFRALRWAVFNRPLGDAFRSNWGGDYTIVEVTLDNNQWVSRNKGKQQNNYTIGGNEKEEQVFSALSTGVPDQVVSEFNLSDINWQGQMDAPFMLSESAGEVSRQLNSVADLSKIDSSIEQANRFLRQVKATVSEHIILKGEISEQLKVYADVDEMNSILTSLEKKKSLADTSKNKFDKGMSLLADAETKRVELEKLPKLEMDQVEAVCSGVGELLILQKKIKTLLDRMEGKQKAETVLQEIGNIPDATKIRARLEELLEAKQKFTVANEKLTEKEDLIQTLENCQVKLVDEESLFTKLFPDVCPLCGKPK